MKRTFLSRLSIFTLLLVVSLGVVPSVTAQAANPPVPATTEAQVEGTPGDLILVEVPSFYYSEMLPVAVGTQPLGSAMDAKNNPLNRIIVNDARGVEAASGWTLSASIGTINRYTNGFTEKGSLTNDFAVTLMRPSKMEVNAGPAPNQVPPIAVPVMAPSVPLTSTAKLFIKTNKGMKQPIEWKFTMLQPSRLTIGRAQTEAVRYMAAIKWVLATTP